MFGICRKAALFASDVCGVPCSAGHVSELEANATATLRPVRREVEALLRGYLTTGGHRVLEVMGKGGKERRVPLHPEACDHLETWLETAAIRTESDGPLFRAAKSGQGQDGFRNTRLSKRAVQRLMRRYALRAGLDLAVTVHSLRVTAITTARERGADILALQSFAGHSDARTTLTYIRNRDQLTDSPGYLLKY